MKPRRPRAEEQPDQPVIAPPASVTVDHVRQPLLWLPDGTPLTKRIGFDLTTRKPGGILR